MKLKNIFQLTLNWNYIIKEKNEHSIILCIYERGSKNSFRMKAEAGQIITNDFIRFQCIFR